MAKVITFGEIMLRLATPGHLRFGQADSFEVTFGGGEANVAVSLANYGIDAEFITRLPDNDIARACLCELRGLGVETRHCVKGGDRIGIYFLETGAVSRASKVIYDRAYSAVSEIRPGMIDWDEVFKGRTGSIGPESHRPSAKEPPRPVSRPFRRPTGSASQCHATLISGKNYGNTARQPARCCLSS